MGRLEWEQPSGCSWCTEDARLPHPPRPAPAVLSLTLPVGKRSRLENGRVSWREARRALHRVLSRDRRCPVAPRVLPASCRLLLAGLRPPGGTRMGGITGNLSHGRVQSGRSRGRSERKNNSSGISPCGRACRWRGHNSCPAPPWARTAGAAAPHLPTAGRGRRFSPSARSRSLSPVQQQGPGDCTGGAKPWPAPPCPAPAEISLILGCPGRPMP